MVKDGRAQTASKIDEKRGGGASSRVRNIAYIAMGTALISVCSWIAVPAAVPFTMQTFAVFFCLFFLGGARGLCSICAYVLLGLAGVPVFAGFGAGIGALIGPSGGFIIGFVVCAALYWCVVKLFHGNFVAVVIAAVIGHLLCYVVGTVWYSEVYLGGGAVSVGGALLVCVVPYLVPDAAKLVLAYFVAAKLKKRFPDI